MKTSSGFRLSAAICAAILFVGAFSFVSIPTQADPGTKKAADAAEKAMGAAEKLAKECEEAKAKAELNGDATTAKEEETTAIKEAEEAKKDAAEEMAKIGAKPGQKDVIADLAAAAADKAAKDSDAALDKGDDSKEKYAEAKEKAADDADENAKKEDEKGGDPSVNAKKEEARIKRKATRAARRKARRVAREAKEAIEKCKEAEAKLIEAKRLIDVLEKKLAAGAKDEESGGRLVELKKRLKTQEVAKQKPKEPPKSEEPPKPGVLVPPSAGYTVQTKTANGLNTVTFETVPGRIIVNLPDDIRAGDTISGTVFTEPKGDSPEEKEKNQSVLTGTVLDLGGTKIQAERPTFTWTPQNPQPNTPARYQLKIFEVLGQPRPTGTTQSGAFITANPNIQPPSLPIGAVTSADPKISPTFVIPELGQAGRPIVFTGPFDGNSSNTTINASASRTSVQDFETNKGVQPNFRQLTETPREAAFRAPTNITGPIEVIIKEGNVETKGNYRNVGVNLSAPKTNLLKGEKTTLTVQVTGLEGIKKPVPLTLTYQGVILMEGGNYQPLMIQPSQVGADGRYSTTRGITGVQPGGWTATATVVVQPFDISLQDDLIPSRVFLWNTFTGDYIFSCPGCLPPKDQPGGTASPAAGQGSVTGSPKGLSGKGTMTRAGCIITLTHNAPDRRVFAKLDSCTNSGSTLVESTQTATKFTVTDRNTANNVLQAGLVEELDKFFFGAVPSKDDLLKELDDLRERKRYDCAHGRKYQEDMAARIAAIKNALRGFHRQQVLNDPIDDKC